MFRLITCFFLSLCCLAFAGCGKEAPVPSGKDYERIVVVSDLHYPSKATDDAKRQAIIDNKVKARDEINGWKDVDLKVFTGDMVEMYGSMKQMEEAKQFIDGFHGEKSFLAGNHELFYREELKNGKPVMADPSLRKAHEENYEKVFGPLHSTKKLGQYLLVFLSPEDTDGKFPVAMSKEEMEWLKSDLQKVGKEVPVVVSIHVPMLSLYYPVVEGNFKGADMICNTKDVFEVLNGYNVQLVLQGHQHIYEQIQERNRWFVTAGAVSAYWWGGAFLETEEGYLLVRVDENNRFSWEYVDYGWSVGNNNN